jgi:PEP-CTERM motif
MYDWEEPMSPRNRLTSEFDKKWTSYALAGGAIFVAPLAAHASPIVSTVDINLNVADNGGLVQQDLDVDGDLNPDFTFSAFDVLVNSDNGPATIRGTLVQPFSGNAILQSTNLPNIFASALGPGDTVGPAGTFNNIGAFRKGKEKNFFTFEIGEWPNDLTKSKYVGLQFLISDETHYGWALVSTQLGSAHLQVTQVGYESNADTPIDIPAGVPEPSSMAMMLMGAAGVTALKLRRRRTQN